MQPRLKTAPIRSEAYRRLIASFPCIQCGRHGNSQAAHQNSGRGLGQKQSDLNIFPLCADGLGHVGCHSAHDQLRGMTLDERRGREVEYVSRTQDMAIRASWDDWRVRALLERIGLVKS